MAASWLSWTAAAWFAFLEVVEKQSGAKDLFVIVVSTYYLH